MRAIAHLHRHLRESQPVLVDEDRRLDLRVVARVIARKELDTLAIQRLETRSRVRNALPGEERHQPREPHDPDPPRKWSAVGHWSCKSRTGDDVRRSSHQDVEQLSQICGDVLPVPVQPHRCRVSALERILEACLNRSADPQVEGESDDGSPVPCRRARGAVDRSVIDDDDVERRIEALISSITAPTASPSLCAGTIAITRP